MKRMLCGMIDQQGVLKCFEEATGKLLWQHAVDSGPGSPADGELPGVLAETGFRLDIARDYDPSIPDILGDREQLIQAVLNIVRNAMQAIEGSLGLEKGEITLQTRALRQFTIGQVRHRLVCRIQVIDNGPGIPDEIVESIFYPMVSGRAEGTGLGLSITQNIVSQHQGLIECESAPGRTVFTLFLPLEHSPGE